LNILIVVYNLYIRLSVFTEKVVVTDDLKVFIMPGIFHSLFQLYLFLSGCFQYGGKTSIRICDGNSYFLSSIIICLPLGILFFSLSLFAVYGVAQKILSKELASFINLAVFMLFHRYKYPVFSNHAKFESGNNFFSLSIYYVYVRKNILLSSLFFILSILSYEIFLPLILLNFF
jgi:hypothetical protein